MASAKKTDPIPKDLLTESQFTLFLGACATVIMGGVAVGMRRQLKKEKFVFKMKEHGSSAVLAFKALFYGTVLSVGSVGIGGTVFCKYNNIQSTQEFAKFMKEKIGVLWAKSPEFIEEEKTIKGLSEKEELSYWEAKLEAAGELEKEEANSIGADKGGSEHS